MKFTLTKNDSEFFYSINFPGFGYFLFSSVIYTKCDNCILIVGGDEFEHDSTSLMIDDPKAVQRFKMAYAAIGGKL